MCSRSSSQRTPQADPRRRGAARVHNRKWRFLSCFRGWRLAGHAATGAQGLRGQQVAGSSGQTARVTKNRLRCSREERARGRRRGHRRCPLVGQKGTPVNVGMKKSATHRTALCQHSCEEIQGIQDRTGERRCSQNPLTYPSKRPAHIPFREACVSTSPARSAAAGKEKSGYDTTSMAAWSATTHWYSSISRACCPAIYYGDMICLGNLYPKKLYSFSKQTIHH